MSQLLRVQNFCVSQDGFGAGEGQSLERPFGHAEPRPTSASWAFATASWPNRTDPGGSRGLDDYFTRDFARNIGAEIMGRNKFGPQRGPWEDLDWKGWWGDTPPFHTPVFVLTHHHRPSFTLADTTFHFLDATPAEALQQAKEAADGKDVRLGGGVATVPRVPRRRPRRHHARRRRADRDRPRGATLELPRGPARPVPPRVRAQPQRRHAPPVLAPVTTTGAVSRAPRRFHSTRVYFAETVEACDLVAGKRRM